MEEVGDKLDATLKGDVENDLQNLKDLVARTTPESMTDADVEDLKAAREKLMGSAQALFQKMYEQTQGAAGADAGASAGPDTGAPDGFEDAVDGEYKEV